MKKVLLLGDSIRMGYDDYVKEELDGKCEVVYDAEDNGRFAAYTLWQANQMFKHHGHFDVVHWNNGYWDMNIEAPMTEAMHPVEEYVHFLKRIIKLCRENGAKIIFATTTPILEPGMAADNTGTQADSTFLMTVVRVTRLKDWNTIPMPRRNRRRLLPDRVLTSVPFTVSVPEVIWCIRFTERSSVDLPAPERPMMATNSPS